MRLDRGPSARAQLAERRRTAEQDERTRIARELHDVLAHSLSQIAVQSGVGLHLFDREPERAREALANIRGSAPPDWTRCAGCCRSSAATRRSPRTAPLTPQPQLGRSRRPRDAAHGPRACTVTLDDRLDGAFRRARCRRAAYRIAQEALTNVVRHSGGSAAPDHARAAHRAGERRPRGDDRRRRHRPSARWRRGCRNPRHARARRTRGRRPHADCPASAPARSSRARLPLGGCLMIRVALADDHQLVRAGFRALLDSEPDIEVVVEAVRRRGAAARDRASPSTSRSWTSGCRTATACGPPSRSPPTPRSSGVRVVIVTTFELDEYVARAIRAGASGFLVKDTEPVELIRAVRVVAGGDALLSPGVTRRLLERAALGMRERADAARARRADRPRDRGAAPGRAGPHERRDRAAPVPLPLTAKTHVSRIMQKLHARDRVQLVVTAYESGLVARRLAVGAPARRVLPREHADSSPGRIRGCGASRVDSMHRSRHRRRGPRPRGTSCPRPLPHWHRPPHHVGAHMVVGAPASAGGSC